MLKLCYTQAFADDTNLTVATDTVQEIESNMNSELAHVSQWLLANNTLVVQLNMRFIIFKVNKSVTQV